MTGFPNTVSSTFLYGPCFQVSYIRVEEIRPMYKNDRKRGKSRFISMHETMSIKQAPARAVRGAVPTPHEGRDRLLFPSAGVGVGGSAPSLSACLLGPQSPYENQGDAQHPAKGTLYMTFFRRSEGSPRPSFTWSTKNLPP